MRIVKQGNIKDLRGPLLVTRVIMVKANPVLEQLIVLIVLIANCL